MIDIGDFLTSRKGRNGMAEDFAASLSTMMVQSYGVAIVKPAEGKPRLGGGNWRFG